MKIFRPLVLLLALPPVWAGSAPWTRLDGKDFTILSQEPERDIRNWAVEFEEFRRGIGKILHTSDAPLDPATVLLFRQRRELLAYTQLQNGKPMNLAGQFVRSPIGNFIATTTEFSDEQNRQVIFHEGVHWMVDVGDRQLPLWLNEGLAEVFSTFSTKDNLYNYGQPIQRHVYLLNRTALLPLKDLLQLQPGGLNYNERERTGIFYAESWAFVHYLLFSDRGQERAKYNQLVKALQPGSDPDQVFRQVFGVDCAGMQVRLEEYLRGGSYVITRMHFDRGQVEQSLRGHPADPVEVEVAETSLLTAVGRTTEALPRLLALTAQHPNWSQAWEAWGYAGFLTDDAHQTEQGFAQAATRGSRHPYIYSYLGDAALGLEGTRTTRNLARPVANDAGAARSAFDNYERELALKPFDRHAYDNCALAFEYLEPPTPADMRLLQVGAGLYPNDLLIRAGLAVAIIEQGDVKTGLDALRRIASAHLAVNRDAAGFARRFLDRRDLEEVHQQLSAFNDRQDFAGQIEYIDRTLATRPDHVARPELLEQRQRADTILKIQQAQTAWAAGDRATASQLLEAADAEANSAPLHAQIRELQRQIAHGVQR